MEITVIKARWCIVKYPSLTGLQSYVAVLKAATQLVSSSWYRSNFGSEWHS